MRMEVTTLPKRMKCVALSREHKLRWDKWIATGGTSDNGSTRPPAEGSSAIVYAREYGYALFYAGLLFGSSPDMDPAKIWTRTNIDRFIAAMRKNGYAPKTIKLRLIAIERAIAVLSPEGDRTYIICCISRIPGNHCKRQRATPYPETGDLMTLGQESMKAALELPDERDRAYRYMIGLMIAMLAEVPLRKSMFRTLQWLPDRGLDRDEKTAFITLVNGSHVLVTPTRVKRSVRPAKSWDRRPRRLTGGKRAPKPHPIPEGMVGFLKRWLVELRPCLLVPGESGDRLWLARSGKPISSSQISKEIQRASARSEHGSVSIKDFRTSYAMSERRASPENASKAHIALGHSQTMTYEKYIPHDEVLTTAIGGEALKVFESLAGEGVT